MDHQGHRTYRITTGGGVSACPTPSRNPFRRVFCLLVGGTCWFFAVSVTWLWAAQHWATAESWPVHLVLYAPLWMILLPLVPLVPLVIWLRPRWSAIALVLASFSSVSVSAFNVPWWNLAHDPIEPEETLRLLTCNVQGKDLRIRDLVGFIRDERPDIALLEECSVDLYMVLRSQEGWHIRLMGEFCIASRHPIAEFEPLYESEKKRRIVAVRAKILWSGRLIPVVAVHFMTPRSGLEAIACSPLRGLDSFRQIAAVQRFESGLVRSWVERDGSSLLLAGDLNLTSEHPVYRRDWSAYANAFSSTGWGLGHTMVIGNIRLRIDHVLSGSEWRATRCWVGPEVGSDHRPVMAELGWEG